MAVQKSVISGSAMAPTHTTTSEETDIYSRQWTKQKRERKIPLPFDFYGVYSTLQLHYR